MISFTEWRKLQEMGGSVGTIVTKKDCKNPDFQVQGALCKKKKKQKK